jgi:hypothetical protein
MAMAMISRGQVYGARYDISHLAFWELCAYYTRIGVLIGQRTRIL